MSICPLSRVHPAPLWQTVYSVVMCILIVPAIGCQGEFTQLECYSTDSGPFESRSYRGADWDAGPIESLVSSGLRPLSLASVTEVESKDSGPISGDVGGRRQAAA